MSLILDALKRSEQERQDNADDIVLAEYTVQRSKSHSLVPWMIAAILLLNLIALVFLVIQQPWKSSPAEVVPAPPAIQQPVKTQAEESAPAVSVIPAEDTSPLPLDPKPVVQPLAEQQLSTEISRSVSEIPNRPLSAEQEMLQPKQPKSAKTAPKTAAEKPAAAKTPVSNTKPSTQSGTSGDIPADLLRLEDAPDEVRIKLQTFEVNAHVFSEDPARRFVLLNLKKRREGDQINDFTLERILPNGLIIDFGEGKTLLPLGQ